MTVLPARSGLGHHSPLRVRCICGRAIMREGNLYEQRPNGSWVRIGYRYADPQTKQPVDECPQCQRPVTPAPFHLVPS